MMILYKKILGFFEKMRFSSKGMSLVEMLVVLGIFVFMFTFISQFVRQSRRQSEKLKQGIQATSSLSGILSLIRQDLYGVGYFLDINENLDIQFPIERQDASSNASSNLQENLRKGSQTREGRPDLPVLLSPYFIFEGAENGMDFVSYSFSNSAVDPSSAQWLKIRYFVENCRNFGEEDSGFCLIRSASRYWELEGDEPPEEDIVLLRALEDLKFSYMDQGAVSDNKWDNKWKIEDLAIQGSSVLYPQNRPFPSIVKMEVKKEDSTQVFFFPISSSYLKAWNPYDKAYPGFPKWNPPEKKPERRREERPNPPPQPETSAGVPPGIPPEMLTPAGQEALDRNLNE